MSYKYSKAPITTITYDKKAVEAPTENIYKSISVISKRTAQISNDLKKELLEKLDEFATFNENLEEVFENKEQIEVSRYYEKLPKAHSLALDEWLNNKIYFRDPEQNPE